MQVVLLGQTDTKTPAYIILISTTTHAKYSKVQLKKVICSNIYSYISEEGENILDLVQDYLQNRYFSFRLQRMETDHWFYIYLLRLLISGQIVVNHQYPIYEDVQIERV